MNIEKINKNTWENENVVLHYLSSSKFKNEDKTIFNFIKNNIKNINMIDIGVGGGRTTSFFLDIVDKYIGIDYSRNMIKKCKTRFKDVNFLQMDARNIKFNDNSFNFVLFSHNAIDYFNQDNRIKILSEMYRICENNGYVCFSSHNLYSYNKNLNNYNIVSESILHNTLLSYYVFIQENLKLLNNIGFHDIKLIDRNGNFINDYKNDSAWIYYLCKKS